MAIEVAKVEPAIRLDDALDRKLTELGKRHAFHTYPDTTHAFFNDDRPEVYDAKAASDAWSKTIAFLRQELKA